MGLRLSAIHDALNLIPINPVRGVYRLFCPIEYTRDVEFDIAVRLLGPDLGRNVLDIGSPKFLAAYLAKKNPTLQIYATDIVDRALSEIRQIAKGSKLENIKVQKQDVRSLPYEDKFFDHIFTVSAIEHVAPAEDGDIAAMKEIERVLKDNGTLIITVPYYHDFYVEYKYGTVYERQQHDNESIFFQRFYNDEMLSERLCADKFEIVEKMYIFEKLNRSTPGSTISKYLCRNAWANLFTGPIHKLVSNMALSKSFDLNKTGKPIVCCLKLRKINAPSLATKTVETVKDFYNISYDKEITGRDFNSSLARFLSKWIDFSKNDRFEITKRFLSKRNTCQKDTILDIGCWGGKYLKAIGAANQYKELCGIDIFESSVEQAKKSGIKAEMVDLNIEKIPYSERYFDTVLCLAVIEHVFDPYQVIAEISRVLKNDGVCVFTIPNVAFILNRLRIIFGQLPVTSKGNGWDGGHLHYFTIGTFRKLLLKYGIKTIHVEATNGLPRLRNLCPSLLGGEIVIIGQKQ